MVSSTLVVVICICLAFVPERRMSCPNLCTSNVLRADPSLAESGRSAKCGEVERARHVTKERSRPGAQFMPSVGSK